MYIYYIYLSKFANGARMRPKGLNTRASGGGGGGGV